MKEKFQQFGKAMLVPVSLIALSGLCLGLGGALTTELTVTSFGSRSSRCLRASAM